MHDLPPPPRDPADIRRPGPVDIHVGGRLRILRKLHGFSQERLAAAIGLSAQQLQKYELGRDRIPAARLYDISQALACSIPAFFKGLAEAEPPNAPGEAGEAGRPN